MQANGPDNVTRASGEAPAAPRIVGWARSRGLVDYEAAVSAMEAYVDSIARGEARELIWFLEHPPLYTAGTSARKEDLLDRSGLPVYRTGRGGQFTYHGPGQRVVYLMLDLRYHRRDVRAFVADLERWLIDTLATFGISAECHPGRVGVWVPRPQEAPEQADKIAAIGIRVRRWVSFHGISLNIAPDLSHFSGIVPCGIHDAGVTSLADLQCPASIEDVDDALRRSFERIFAPVRLEHRAPLLP